MIAATMFVLSLAGVQAIAGEQEKGSMSRTYPSGSQMGMSVGQSTGATRVSDIIGSAVKNEKGQELGEVKDIVIGQNGRAQYLILSHDGVLGIGNKLIPIPFQMAQVNQGQKDVILSNVDKQTLEKAPSFDEKDWNALEERDMENKIYGYYGQQRGEPRSQEMEGSNQQQMMKGTERQKQNE